MRKPVIYFTWDQVFNAGLGGLPRYTRKYQAKLFADFIRGRPLKIAHVEVGQVVEAKVIDAREEVAVYIDWHEDLAIGTRL